MSGELCVARPRSGNYGASMTEFADVSITAMRRIVKATEENVRALAQTSGLTASQLMVLQVLKLRGETLNGDLANAVDLKQATVSILVDKLQKRELVERRKGDTDRRRVWIRITQKGEAILRDALDLLQESFLTRFSKLAEWEQASLAAALLKIVALLDAETIDASAVLDIGDVAKLPAENDTPQ